MTIPTPYPRIPGTNLPMLELFAILPEHAELVHGWITDEKARDWLDLGSGRQFLSKRDLYLMLTSARNFARLFRLPGSETPLGLVCLIDVENQMGSAEVWGVRGVYASGPPNISVAAFLLALANGFLEREREVIGSWVVDGNALSIAMHRQLAMTETGRQRSRHAMQGRRFDRLLFDMTRAEFAERFADVPTVTGRSFSQLGAEPAIHGDLIDA